MEFNGPSNKSPTHPRFITLFFFILFISILSITPLFANEIDTQLNSPVTESFPPGGAIPSNWRHSPLSTNEWAVVSDESSEGKHSLKAGPLSYSQTAGIEYSDVFEAGDVKFKIKLSGRARFDNYFRFFVDNKVAYTVGINSFPADTGWLEVVIPINSGPHKLKWLFSDDYTDWDNGEPEIFAWLDDVTLPSISSDIDGDNLIDSLEDKNANGIVDNGETDPFNPDSDNDGLLDGWEDINRDGIVNQGETNPLHMDSDNDGTSDGDDQLPLDSHETVDTDGDGIGNNRDDDDDNDTIPDFLDSLENRNPLVPDWIITNGISNQCVLVDARVSCNESIVGPTLSEVPILSNPSALSMGLFHACALDEIGVHCWGENEDGQNDVPELNNPRAIGTGFWHTCALDDDGVVCWGNNNLGQTDVPRLINPRQISAGASNTCALDNTGVVCWGGLGGQAAVPQLINPSSVVAGNRDTCAVDQTGLVCWGQSHNRGRIPILKKPHSISLGIDGYSCAIEYGKTICWGKGDYYDGYELPAPFLINPVAISAGEYRACALDMAGIFCWSTIGVIYGPNDRSELIADLDKDFDGILDRVEDSNRNGAFDVGEINFIDPDTDDDGVIDSNDTFPLDPLRQEGVLTTTVHQVSSSRDDAEEYDGRITLNSSDLELVQDDNKNQFVGLRFTDTQIPKNAIIQNAYIEFTADEINTGTINLLIEAEARNDAFPFRAKPYDISDRRRTENKVFWGEEEDWTETQSTQQSPDISPIIQELVDDIFWAEGNPIAIIISGSNIGKRVAESFDQNPLGAPKIVVTYLTPLQHDIVVAPSISPISDVSTYEDKLVSIEFDTTYATYRDAMLSVDFSGLPNESDTGYHNFYYSNLDNNHSVGFINWRTTTGNAENSPYSLTVTATDPIDNSLINTESFLIHVKSTTKIERQISHSDDDAEENRSTGNVSLGSPDLELIQDGSINQAVGLRFRNMEIPPNATIINAQLEFNVANNDFGSLYLNIFGELNPNASEFIRQTYDISRRDKTRNTRYWYDEYDWVIGDISRKSPDISAIIQEIVNLNDWQNGNPIAFIITGSDVGKRVATSFNGNPQLAPKLIVEYHVDENDNPRISAPSISPNGGSFNDTVTVNLDSATDDVMLYYTLDNSEPTQADHLYISPFELNESATLKVKGFKNGYTPSSTSSADFIINLDSETELLQRSISRERDDAEEYDDGSIALGSPDLELVQDGTRNQHVGLHFRDIVIPADAVITNAYLEFQVDEVNTGEIDLLIAGEANANPRPFTRTAFNISDRDFTANTVQWNSEEDWSVIGSTQQSPDISAIIQEVIEQENWTSGNPLTIIINGSSAGKRVAKSFKGDTSVAPKLIVEYVQ